MSFATQIGEAFVGEGAEAAHINTVLGALGGPVEVAWTTALATPRAGHSAFVTVIQPGLSVRPPTLFVNKAAVSSERHGTLTWGAAQAGVASGVLWAVADGVIPEGEVDERLLIAAVWVNPEATNEALVFENNRQATRQALEAGRDLTPSVEQLLAVRDSPANPYYEC